jgi:para-aminobenzoate synthetase / 4-amino-4-deoxychorismate lyase
MMGRVVLTRRPLPCSASPSGAARCLRGDERPFALIGAWAGGGAVLGSEPVRVADEGDDPFAALDDLAVIEAGTPGVGGGWFGYLGYELRHRVERCQPSPFEASPLPPFALAFYDHVLRQDGDGAWWFEALWSEARAGALDRRFDVLAERLADPPPPLEARTEGWRLVPGPGGHGALVAACRDRIHAGDLYQANVCGRLEGRLEGSALDLFANAAERLRPDRAAYLEGPWGAVASLSPELFLQRRGRRVLTAPIKGTRPRDRRAELERSAKDRAENTMIVDLMRNDLGRVCEPGSVAVTALAQARPHAGVWHLVSEVEGRLRPDVGDAELLRATFPPGSVTGAPKLAAIDVISELESAPRAVYTGAIGFASPAAGLELSVAIRTFEVRGGAIRLGVGGGVVADSDPAEETGELAVKAAPLLEAIGAEGPAEAERPVRLAPVPRLGPRPLPRPDPALGVFETMLVRDGEVKLLELHLERLATSLDALYGAALPERLRERVTAAAVGAGRLRLTVRPGEPPEITTGPLAPQGPVTLRSWTVPGGLGPHKWRDRRLLEALEAEGALPLLVDADGLVLEASRANVFALGGDGVLRTPPADDRILPGVTRRRLVGDGAVEAALTLDDLAAAAGVWITSALRGAVAVRELDGTPLRVQALTTTGPPS